MAKVTYVWQFPAGVDAPEKARFPVVSDDNGTAEATAERLTIRTEDGAEFTVDPSTFPETIRQAAMMHGFKQIFGDNFAGRSGPEGVALCEKRAEHMKAGQWAGAGGGTGDGLSQADRDLAAAIEAVATAKGIGLGDGWDGAATVAEWPKEKKAAKRKLAPVAAELADIRNKRAAEKAKAAKKAAKADDNIGDDLLA